MLLPAALASRPDSCSAANRMADLLPVIETYEHRWMRAWVGRDSKALKSLTARNFVMLIGSKPPVLLDAPSWLEAATSRYLCKSYRFSDSMCAASDRSLCSPPPRTSTLPWTATTGPGASG